MKLKHYIYKGIAMLLMAVIGFACQSCSEDVPERGNDVGLNPKGQISVTVATQDVKTRALTGFTADPADNELIHTCVVAFVKEDGKVVKVLDLPENTTGVDKQDFSVMLSAGSYRAYAFANFDAASLASLNLDEDTELTLEDFENLLIDVKADEKTSVSLIPMSGTLNTIVVATNGTVTLDGESTSEVTIPVTRMLGKLEFQFTNASSSALTVTEISFKPTATGNVNLLPSDAISPGTIKTDGVTKYPNLTINATGENTSDNFSFYVREIVESNHPTGHFPISIKYKVGDSNKEEEMTALLYDLVEIHRNDWIRVPITLTDYRLKLDVEFYPPIGGYPPVALTEKEDEYYVTFGTGGWFGIEASVVNKADGTIIDTKKVEIIKVEYDDNASTFFRKKPAVESSGELTGEIKSGLTKGATSVVTIKVTVTEDTNVKTFTRKIHFIYN